MKIRLIKWIHSLIYISVFVARKHLSPPPLYVSPLPVLYSLTHFVVDNIVLHESHGY